MLILDIIIVLKIFDVQTTKSVFYKPIMKSILNRDHSYLFILFIS